MSKLIKCSYKGCGDRQNKYGTDEIFERQSIEVSDDYYGICYCSFTCAIYAGYYSLRADFNYNKNDKHL